MTVAATACATAMAHAAAMVTGLEETAQSAPPLLVEGVRRALIRVPPCESLSDPLQTTCGLLLMAFCWSGGSCLNIPAAIRQLLVSTAFTTYFLLRRPSQHGTCFGICECSASGTCSYSDDCTQYACDEGYTTQVLTTQFKFPSHVCIMQQDLTHNACRLSLPHSVGFAEVLATLPCACCSWSQ